LATTAAFERIEKKKKEEEIIGSVEVPTTHEEIHMSMPEKPPVVEHYSGPVEAPDHSTSNSDSGSSDSGSSSSDCSSSSSGSD
jgi:hypothetical protein